MDRLVVTSIQLSKMSLKKLQLAKAHKLLNCICRNMHIKLDSIPFMANFVAWRREKIDFVL